MPTEYLGMTDGTWWFNPDGGESCSDPTVEGPDGPIATIHHITRVVGEGAECHVEYGHFEDGYVIAAAPDMYAALNYAFAKMPSDDPDWRRCIEQADAALRLAKGERT